MAGENDGVAGLKKIPIPPVKKAVTIKFGDVMISVEGEDTAAAKRDALEIFELLEGKYSQYWSPKMCKEKTTFG